MITINRNSKIPLYMQIYNQLKKAITNNILPANTKILSKRKMSKHLSVSINTIELAYSQLVSEGFIESKPKKGFFVCKIDKIINSETLNSNINYLYKNNSKNNIKIDFSINGIDKENFPYNTIRKIIRYSINENKNFTESSPSQGEYELRSAISSYIYISRGVKCLPQQIIIGAGTDNLIQILSYILENTCSIAMENPVYNESYLFFKRMGHNVISIPIDNKGIQIEPLNLLKSAAVYITPSHQFPLGITMPINRRIQLLNWANKEENRYIIEDDYDSEFRYNTKPIPALKSNDNNDKVIYLGSFSRSISPSLRISYMILPNSLLNIYNNKYKGFSCAVSKFDQIVLTNFILNGQYESHINKMRKLYKEKRIFLLNQLKNIFDSDIEIYGENAGQHLLVKINNGLSENELCSMAKKYKVNVYPISPFFINEVPKKYKSTILLGYATLNYDEILEGINLLKKAWINKK